MPASPHTQALLLLTAHLSGGDAKSAKPLSPAEWRRFSGWLEEKSLTPEKLMSGRFGEHLEGWTDKTITPERLERLMDRGVALALSMEKWSRAGLWVMTQVDSDYPERLQTLLEANAPAVLFGCGNRKLLSRGGLAVVGSRKAGKGDLDYARALGALAANNGHSIVSGGAGGIDEAAMLGALEAEGTVVGVLSHGLLRACSSRKYLNHIMEQNLVLLSTQHPDAGFSVGAAMGRNRYIYCLADAAFVVHSGKTGGTWHGANENLKKQWVPLWVKRTSDKEAGNQAIAEAGAGWAPENIKELDYAGLLSVDAVKQKPREALAAEAASKVEEPDVEYRVDKPADAESIYQDIYSAFLALVRVECSEVPKSPGELAKKLDVKKTQLDVWLKRAVKEQKLDKLSKPVRYQWKAARQGSLIEDGQ